MRLFFATLILWSFLRGPALDAQTGTVALTRGDVTAVLDTVSGRFGVERAGGTNLLFRAGIYVTSHVSVMIDGTVFTNYRKSELSAPYPQQNLGKGAVEILPERLRYSWDKYVAGRNVRIILELEPVSDSVYAEVRVRLIVENRGRRAISCGMTVMEDVCAGEDDAAVLLSCDSELREERTLRGGDVPERLTMRSEVFLPDSGICRLRGHALTTPDELTVGRWSYGGYLGTAVYGYQASGRAIGDAAVLLQWNAVPVAVGERRETATAVALRAPQPERTDYPSTFAREFSVPMNGNLAFLAFFSDTTAVVHVRTPRRDAWWESAASRDGKWDTTIVVRPDKPDGITIWFEGRPFADSTEYYQHAEVRVSSTSDIGIALMPDDTQYGFIPVWPDDWLDSMYLLPGGFAGNRYCAGVLRGEGKLIIEPTVPYCHMQFHSTQSFEPAGKTLAIELPDRANYWFYSTRPIVYNPWDPFWKITDPKNFFFGWLFLTPAGQGDNIRYNSPFHLIADSFGSFIRPGDRRWVIQGRDASLLGYLFIPSRRQLGREYFIVPFRKPGAWTNADLVRIIAYEDGTEIRLDPVSPPIRLDRSGYVDTLVASPTTIRSNQPIAVYQHHLDWEWLGLDTVAHGSRFTLLPPGMWGRKYFVHPAVGRQPNILPLLDGRIRDAGLSFNELYLIIMRPRSNTAPVEIDGYVVDEGRFRQSGEYSWAYVDITDEYHVVESACPIFVVVCGEVDHHQSPYHHDPMGMSWVPPYR
jgi:hypothetical protein